MDSDTKGLKIKTATFIVDKILDREIAYLTFLRKHHV